MSDEELLRRLKPMLKRRFSKFLTASMGGSSCETWRSIMARNGIELNSPDNSGLSLWDPVWGDMSVAREDALKILFLGELL